MKSVIEDKPTIQRWLVLTTIFVFSIPNGAFGNAQEGLRARLGTHGLKTYRAMRTELPIVVGGNLGDPAWQGAVVSLGLIQRDPHEGEPSTEKTEFRILYTPTILYLGVICYDSDPAGRRFAPAGHLINK